MRVPELGRKSRRREVRYGREQVEMSGSTQQRYSKMPEGESDSWLEGISELTEPGGIQAVHYHHIKGAV